jgi:hypothetical protein
VEHLEERPRRLLVGLGPVADDDHLRPAAGDHPRRQAGVDAEGTRLVGRAGDDLVRHDHRAPAQPRVVALLDGREERVGVGVQEDHASTQHADADNDQASGSGSVARSCGGLLRGRPDGTRGTVGEAASVRRQ